jgi:WD40 repeat protein
MNEANVERDQRVAQLLDEALAESRSPGGFDTAAFRQRHPDDADEVLRLLDTVQALDGAVTDCREAAPPTAAETVILTSQQPGQEEDRKEAPPRQIGRYRILGMLGSGGMGTVYKAHDPHLNRTVAVKVPNFAGPEALRSERQLRFLREARAAATVRHANVCPIYDVGEQEGLPYVVMAYVEGPSLAEQLARHAVFDGREAAELVRQLALALAAVHGHGIVHRDLKPANVLLDGGGTPLLTDFGLARDESDSERLTADGAVLGTPAYMAPEQAAMTGEAVGNWTDIYALGVLLYRLVAGRTPFEGQPLTVIYQVAEKEPPPPSQFRADIEAGLEKIITTAMARRPEDRYRNAEEMAAALQQWLDARTTVAAPAAAPAQVQVRVDPPRPAGGSNTRERRRWHAFGRRAVLVALAVLLVGGGLEMYQIIIRIKDKDGNVVAENKVPRGGAFEVVKDGNNPPEQPPASYPLVKLQTHFAPLDQLRPEDIPAAERFDGQPKELVQVLGSHAWHDWGHWSLTPGLAFGKDGKQVIALGPDLRVWDAATNRDIARFQVKERYLGGEPQAFGYSPDGKVIGGLFGDREYWEWRLFDVEKKAERVRLPGQGGYRLRGYGFLAFSPDGKHAATGPGDLKLWDALSGKELHSFPHPEENPQENPRGAAFSPDGKRLVCIFDSPKGGYRAVLYDVDSRKELARLGPTGGERPFFSPDGKTLVAADKMGYDPANDGSILFFDVETRGRRDLELKSGGKCFAFSPNGKQFFWGTLDLYDTATLKPVLRLSGPRGDPCAWYGNVFYSCAFSPDGQRLAAADEGGRIMVWDTGTGKLLNPVPDPVGFLALAPDNKTLAVISDKHTITLLDVTTGKARAELALPPNRRFMNALFSPDGKTVVTWVVGRPQPIQTWDVATGKELTRRAASWDGWTGDDLGHDCGAFSADGKLFAASGGGEGTVWDTQTWKVQTGINCKGPFRFPVFSPDGKLVAGVATEGLKVFDADTGAERVALREPGPAEDKNLIFVADGKRLVGPNAETPAGVSVYNVAEGQKLFSLPGSEYWTNLLAHPDGKSFFSVSHPSGTITQWSATADKAEKLREWPMPGVVHRLAITTDGRYLFTSNHNGTVYILRLAREKADVPPPPP